MRRLVNLSRWFEWSLSATAVLAIWPAVALAQPKPTQPSLPNVVVILADDLGWNDVGYHGSEVRTPTIDRIAKQGVELDRFYAQPTCSPTRAALMTGKSPARLGIVRPLGKNERSGLPTNETILPQYFARLGYETQMVGKWHLGNYTVDLFPHRRGFEHFYGYLCGGIGYWDHNHGGGHDWQRDGVTVRESGYATELLADEAVRVIDQHDPQRPLFLYLAFGAPHLPNEAPSPTIETYAEIDDENRRIHAAMVTELDTAIARVLGALDARGDLKNTLLVFSSDNGGLVRNEAPKPMRFLAKWAQRIFDRPMPLAGLEFVVSNVVDAGSDNTPLPGGKGTVGEGGARVPAAIWWPGRLEGGRYDGFVSVVDLLPTLLHAVAGEDEVPEGLDGASQWASLTGTGKSPRPDFMVHGYTDQALYRPPWKLHSSDGRLFDVRSDPTETRDLAREHPDVVASMTAEMEAWPKVERESTSVLGFLWDPDSFGGAEDREPWAEAARARSPKR